MKFEKINDNKLKIFISSDELPESETLDELMSDSDIARNEFLAILDEAYNKVGFDTNNYKIKIDAKSSYDGGFVFTVTKIVKLIEKNKKVKPKKIAKKNSTDKSKGSIGIVDYIYEESYEYWKERDFREEGLISRIEAQAQKMLNSSPIEIKVRPRASKKNKYSMVDDDDDC